MDTRAIGSLSVSAVGLGCNNFGWHIGEPAAAAVVHAALDAGVTHFDTADVYGEGESERMLGRALGAERQRVVVATKFGNRTGGAPETVRASAEASLRRLGTDYIDLYYLHKPDPATPVADTLGALDALVREGKVREVACSNLTPRQLREAHAAAPGARFVALQNEYSLLHRTPEGDAQGGDAQGGDAEGGRDDAEGDGGTLAACRDLGLAFVPYFPLKSGLLTGKYRAGSPPPDGSRLAADDASGSAFAGMGDRLLTDATLATVERLAGWAEAREHTVLDLAFAWLLARAPVASVIAGATRPGQIRQNAAAAAWALSEAEVAEVDALLGDG